MTEQDHVTLVVTVPASLATGGLYCDISFPGFLWFLAQPKKSKTVSATTPWILTWGNQESIRPLSRSALQAVPSPRIKALAQPKKDFCLQIQLRKEEEEERRMKISSPSSPAVQYENIVRLATPKTRGRSAQEVKFSRLWLFLQVSRGARITTASARIQALSTPKALSKDYIPPREPTWQP
ncbi:testicular haploid expressed gene protein-like [Sinocyclocheilus rhinocerous]|uniref:testicular haploid expressed gene protein-like n=1 Tax=Sinocyclocheilus rhinocerous TaxID=307959 RepID=UPI0007B84A8B|nr:PREDICTED: testicular haploid expressed gene protein-like [Sinocyclocheilus rhinocerous]